MCEIGDNKRILIGQHLLHRDVVLQPEIDNHGGDQQKQ